VRKAKGGAISVARRAGRDARVRAAGFEPSDWHERILPGLRARRVTAKDVAAATGLSSISCYRVLSGTQVPAAQHWSSLAELADLTR
jgi:hypothetical protein